MASRYPEGVLDFIKENYKTMARNELTEEVNRRFGTHFTITAMSACKKRYGLKDGIRQKVYSDVFPKEVSDFILANYLDTGHQQMADLLKEQFGRDYTAEQIKAFYRNRHLNCGHTGHEIGRPAHNKGVPMSPEAYEKCKGTMFKKGDSPINKLPVGSEVLSGDGYHWVKTADPNIWVAKQRLLWEQAYGPIPEGAMICFKDGNKDNVVLENLMLETKEEHALMNIRSYSSLPAEAKETGLNIVKLMLKTKEKKKKCHTSKKNAWRGTQ